MKKTYLPVIIFTIAAICFFTAACSNGTDPEPGGGQTVVTATNLSTVINIPVAGQSPQTELDQPQYISDNIEWKAGDDPHTGPFANGVAYTAVVNLTAKPGYTFTGLAANSFTHSHADSVTNPAGSGIVTIVFPETALRIVDALDLTEIIAAPAGGGTPQIEADHAQYSGTIEWKAGDDPHTGPFANGVAYTAEVTLTVKPGSGYTFTGLVANSFTHTEADFVTNPAGSGTVIDVTIDFPETTLRIVDALDLTEIIAAPAGGGTPQIEADHAQYSGLIEWKAGDNPHTGQFAAGVAYTAVANLEAKAGYTFDGFEEDSFTHEEAESVTNEAGSGTVTIEFPQIPTPVTPVDLGPLIPLPVHGNTPQTEIAEQTQFTGAIAWQTEALAPLGSTEKFSGGSVYRAVITLTPKTGFSFDGVAANTFTYTPVRDRYTISNVAGSNEIIILFKPAVFELRLSSVNYPALRVKVCCQQTGMPKERLIDGNFGSNTAWQYIHGNGTGDYLDELIALAGTDMPAIGSFCGQGHVAALNNVTNIPEGNKRAHFITYDMGTKRQIAGMTYFPYNNGNGLGNQPSIIRYDVFVSDSVEIGVDPYVDGVRLMGGGKFELLPAQIADGSTLFWQSVDLTKLNDGTPVETRYVQFRLYSVGWKNDNSLQEQVNWPEASAAELTIAVYEDPANWPPVPVNTGLNLTGLIAAPVSGVPPQRSFTVQDQYTGTIEWNPAVASGDVFEKLQVYQAILTLTAGAGFTFNTVASNAFTYTGATSINTSANGTTATVTITFPETENIDMVSDTNLTALVTAAVRGQTPVTTPLDRTQYTGTVSWLGPDGNNFSSQFGTYTVYRAVVELTAKQGFTFGGLGANSFTHSNAISVNFDIDITTVTISFKTAPEYPSLTGKTIYACCWMENTPPSTLIDGITAWDNGWGCPPNTAGLTIHSSWPDDLPNRAIAQTWSIVDSSLGHRYDFFTTHNNQIQTKAHFFTIDLGEIMNIATLDHYPRGSNATTVSNIFARGQIYVSDTEVIAVNPLNNPAIRRVADFNHTGQITSFRWYEVDIGAQNDWNPVSGRYIQVRFTDLDPASDWLNGFLSELRVGVKPD